MSNTISSSSQSISDLASLITKRFDTDRDGRLSTQEFSAFLSNLLGTSTTNNTATNNTAARRVATADPTTTANRVPKGTLAGYDAAKLANPDHKTFKYQLGRILQYYPNTPQGLRDALPEIQQSYPNAKIVGTTGDKLDFDGDVIDVILSASTGGSAWQFLPVGS
jgi:hypothetical protein